MDHDKMLDELGTIRDALRASGGPISVSQSNAIQAAINTINGVEQGRGIAAAEPAKLMAVAEPPARVTINTLHVTGGVAVFGEQFEPAAASLAAWDEAEDEAYGDVAFGRGRVSGFMRRIAERIAEAELANVLAEGGGFDLESIIDAIVDRLETRWQDRPLLQVLLAFVKSDLFKALVASLLTPAPV